MTPQPLPQHELANAMTELATSLSGQWHAADVLTLAGFLASQALRCMPPPARMEIAQGFCDNVLATLRESLD
jgi:hypothetical protein